MSQSQRMVDAVEGNTHGKSKWAILFTVLVMTFMATLDSSIVNVALPVMQKELAVGLDQIQWVSSVYLLTTCALLLVFGRLGDIFGKVLVFQVGVAAFSLGSLLCGMAVTLPAVVAARAVRGPGGGAPLPKNLGINTVWYPPRHRGRALGILASFVALGMMCGPVLGGFIVSVLPWEFIFLINVPVGVVSLVVGLKTLPRVRPERGRSLDVVGSLLIVPGIMLTFFALTSLQAGASPALVAMLAAGVALLVLFALVERRAQDPLVVLEVFSQRSFLVNVACLFISFVAIGVYELMTPFYLQDARGFSPTLAGLVFCVIPLANAVSGPISGAVSDRIGCELPTCVGMLLFAVGLALVGLFGVDTGLPCILACLALASLGTSIFQSPNNSLIMGSLPPEALGFGGSVSALARYLGMAVGISASTSLLYGQMSVAAGESVTSYVAGRPDIFLYGYRWVYGVTAVLVAAGFALTLARLVLKRARRAGGTEHAAPVRGSARG